MSFYDNFVYLCDLKKVTPSRAAEDCGINRCNVSSWKKGGYTPRGAALNRIADYFGISVSDLLSEDIKKEPVPTNEDELLLQAVDSRPLLQELVRVLSDADDEQIQAVLKLLSRQ